MVVIAVLLAGCAGTGTSAKTESAATAPVEREVLIQLVSTPEGTPIAGAVVRARPQNPKHVMRVSDYLRSTPSPVSVQTDTNGRARLVLPADRPFELVVAAPGRAPESISFDGAELLTDAPRVFVLPVGSGAAGGSVPWWGELRCGPARVAQGAQIR